LSLQITGTSSLTKVFPQGGQELTLKLNVKNTTSGVQTISSAVMFWAIQGGWSFNMGDQISSTGRFFGLDPGIGTDPSGYSTGLFTWKSGEPISYIIIQIHVINSSGEEQDLLQPITVKRSGDYTSPAKLKIKPPVYLGLMEPMDVISILNVMQINVEEQKWLTIMGQLVN
jgi:hypothetical protein